jgi:type VI secretion system secreted protein Hcp
VAVDMYLKLDSVNGESIDDSHADEIDLLSCNFGATQTGTAHTGGGAGAGRVQVRDLILTKRVDRASAVLFSLCCKGEHLAKAQVTVRRAGGRSPLEYLKVHLEKVLITAYSTGGNETDEELTETLSLNFAKMRVEYTPQKGDGSGAPSIIKGWDIGANKVWD